MIMGCLVVSRPLQTQFPVLGKGEVTESKSIVYIARNDDVCLYSGLQPRHRLLLRVSLVTVLRGRLPTSILTFAAEEMTDELE
jgi:hypothetical protein